MLEITQAADSESATLPSGHSGQSPYGQAMTTASSRHSVSPNLHPSAPYVPGHSRGLSNGSSYTYTLRDTQTQRIERSPGIDDKMMSAVNHRRQSYSNAQQMPPSDSQQAMTRHAAQLASQTYPHPLHSSRVHDTTPNQQSNPLDQERRKRLKRTPSPSGSAHQQATIVSGQRTVVPVASGSTKTNSSMLRLHDSSPPTRSHPVPHVGSNYPSTSSSLGHRDSEYARTSVEQLHNGTSSTSRRAKRGLAELEEEQDVEVGAMGRTSEANSRSAKANSIFHQSRSGAQSRVPGKPKSLSPLEDEEGEVEPVSIVAASRVNASPRTGEERSLGVVDVQNRPGSPYAPASKNNSPKPLASSVNMRTSNTTPVVKGDVDRDRERWEAALNKKRGHGSGTHSPSNKANEVEAAR